MRLKFVRGKCYNGVTYGPGYPEQEAEVDDVWARKFLASGAAVMVVPVELPPVSTLTTDSIADAVESRDPVVSTRRGRRR